MIVKNISFHTDKFTFFVNGRQKKRTFPKKKIAYFCLLFPKTLLSFGFALAFHQGRTPGVRVFNIIL